MKFLVTGAAGFIGANVSKRLLEAGHQIVGIDNLNDYYDVSLKLARLELLKSESFTFHKLELADREGMATLFAAEKFDRVIHLAAQAGRDVLVDGINCQVGAEFERNLALAFDGLEQDNLGGAGVFSKLHHEQTDHATADNDNCAAGLDVAHIDAVQAAGDGLGHCALFKAGIFSKKI